MKLQVVEKCKFKKNNTTVVSAGAVAHGAVTVPTHGCLSVVKKSAVAE